MLKHDFRNELIQREMNCIRIKDTLTPEDEEKISYEMGGIYYPKLRLIMAQTTMKEELVSVLGHVIFEDMKVSDWIMFKDCMEGSR